ncbi:MAG: tetratricopeptide repeat protein [Gemmataceae bacterium]
MKRHTQNARLVRRNCASKCKPPRFSVPPTRKSVVALLLSLLPAAFLGIVGCAQFPGLTPPVGGGHSNIYPIGPQQAQKTIRTPAKLHINEQAKVCLQTAEEMEKGGKFKEAIHFYDQTRRKDPRQKQVCRRMAVLYDQLGNFTKAEEEYRRALALTPEDPELLSDIGYSFYCQGRWRAAEAYLQKALKKNPEHRRSWVNLGMTLGQQNRYRESLDAFQKVLPMAQAYCNLAFVYRTQQKVNMAMAAYNYALEVQPNFRPAVNALAQMERGEKKKPAPVIAKQTQPQKSPYQKLMNFRFEKTRQLVQQTPTSQAVQSDSENHQSQRQETTTRFRGSPQRPTSQSVSIEWENPPQERGPSTFADR